MRVFNAFGRWAIAFAVLYLVPIGVSIVYRDGAVGNFLVAALVTLAVGACIVWMTRHAAQDLKPRDGFLLIVLVWIGTIVLASLPIGWTLTTLDWTDILFETTAGLTTTGATVLRNLDGLPHSINIWRCTLQWVGGWGAILLAAAVLPILGVGGRQWYRAETLGPLKGTQVVRRIVQATRMLGGLYVALTVACALALTFAGMEPFDAVAHAFTTVSLGGFSTHSTNIAFFHSQAIETTLIVFMLAAALNFVTHFLALRRISLRPYREDKEVTGTLVLVAASVVGITLYLIRDQMLPDAGVALREVAFNLVSLATTCGFVSDDFTPWPAFACFWMLFLSCLSAGSGSPGGGIKMFRSLILLRQSVREMRTLVHPSAVTPLRIGGRALSPAIVQSVVAFIFVYFACAAVLLFALLLSGGLDFQTAVSTIISCTTNTGPALGLIGPELTYAGLSVFQKWICILAMLAGRVEVFVLLIVFVPAFWRR